MSNSAPAADIKAPLLSYFGSKFRVAAWVIAHLPPHDTYIEPFGGSAAVLLQKARSRVEIYNDLDGEIVNLFRVVRDDVSRERLVDALESTPYSRAEFDAAWNVTAEPIERARRLCVRAQMGFGATGSTRPLQSPTGFAADVWVDGPGLWARYPARLGAIGARMRGVLIENVPAVELIARHDAAGVLFYVDPPYFPESRSSAAHATRRDYRHEMTVMEHVDLLAMLVNLRGMAVVSGYASDVYEKTLVGWARFSCSARAQGQGGSVARSEALWVSPSACVAAGFEPGADVSLDSDDDMPLFSGMGRA
mgnify:CR=1 FL=1